MTIASNLRAPIFAVEFDSSRAAQGPALLPYKVLMLGQKTAAGTKAALELVQVTNASQAREYFGAGSVLALMCATWFLNNVTTSLYVMPLADHASGVAATGTLTVTGPATASGTLNVYIGGKKVTAAVTSGDAATAVATALAAAINADTDLPVTASPASAVVTLTTKNKGLIANEIDVRVNYYSDDVYPAGISVAVVALASGATNPVIQTALDLLGDEWYQLFVGPYNDAANLTALETFLDARFGPLLQIDGYYITAKMDTFGNLTTFGNGRNSKFVNVMAATKIPSSVGQVAAAVAGQVAYYGNSDPARPFQTLELKGILSPSVIQRLTYAERNNLLYDGISTFQVDQGGKVLIERLITMYQTNASGSPDTAYLDLNTPLTLQYLRYSLRNRFTTKFPRSKLAKDGVIGGPNQQIVTPSVAKAEVLAWFREMESLGLVEGVDQFKNDLIVAISTTDPNRLEIGLSPDLVNQFRVGAATISFLL